MRLGFVARMDNSGLGNNSWEFARWLRPDKILLMQNGVYQCFPERYAEFNTRTAKEIHKMSVDDFEWITKDIDVVLSLELFYKEDFCRQAKRIGVKTALVTMIEMMRQHEPERPDLYICPSPLDYKLLKEPKVMIPVPLNTDVLEWRRRGKAHTFIHTGSHGGINGRKGTFHVIEAMKHVTSDIKLIIYSWKNFIVNDPRIEVRHMNFKHYWQCWREGEVLVYPQDYNGICNPIIEAMACGLGVITTDLYPFNEYMHPDLMFKSSKDYQGGLGGDKNVVPCATIDPKLIAEKIDWIAGKDVGLYSDYGKEFAAKNNWQTYLPQYREALEGLLK